MCFFYYYYQSFLGRIVVRLIVHVTDCLADETNNKVHNVRNRVQNRLVTEYRGFASHKGAEQPALPCSLISTFVIHLLKSTIPRLATSEISMF